MTLDMKMIRQAIDNASYIPFLNGVPDQLAGVAIVTVDGDILSKGDTEFRFALESISKYLLTQSRH